ncbi:hypothetical protein BGZ63DRAFT_173391 [Mariannaea sp. PMI_226]|nr:hypothetical protein BGZ63DRAFT_173391 [Mariannaea sp. PMI_226]
MPLPYLPPEMQCEIEKPLPYLPPEMQCEITNRLDLQSAANAYKAGWAVPPKRQPKIDHKRVWGSIFRDKLQPKTVLQGVNKFRKGDELVGDLWIIGLDLEYLYLEEPRPNSTRPLHLLLAGVNEQDSKPLIIKSHEVSQFFCGWRYEVGGKLFEDSNIMLHFGDQHEIETLWSIGIHQTFALSYRKIKKCGWVPISCSVKSVSSGDFTFERIPIMEYTLDFGPETGHLCLESKKVHGTRELLEAIHQHWFIGN